MTKKIPSKRLASAQERLRRIEATIGPYVDNRPFESRRPNTGWVPSDAVNATRKPSAKKLREERIAAISN